MRRACACTSVQPRKRWLDGSFDGSCTVFCSFFLIARGRYKGFETPRFRVLGCRVLVFQVDYHESVVSLDMSVLHSLLLLSSPFFASFSWCQTLQTSNEPHSPDLAVKMVPDSDSVQGWEEQSWQRRDSSRNGYGPYGVYELHGSRDVGTITITACRT